MTGQSDADVQANIQLFVDRLQGEHDADKRILLRNCLVREESKIGPWVERLALVKRHVRENEIDIAQQQATVRTIRDRSERDLAWRILETLINSGSILAQIEQETAEEIAARHMDGLLLAALDLDPLH